MHRSNFGSWPPIRVPIFSSARESVTPWAGSPLGRGIQAPHWPSPCPSKHNWYRAFGVGVTQGPPLSCAPHHFHAAGAWPTARRPPLPGGRPGCPVPRRRPGAPTRSGPRGSRRSGSGPRPSTGPGPPPRSSMSQKVFIFPRCGVTMCGLVIRGLAIPSVTIVRSDYGPIMRINTPHWVPRTNPS